MPPAPEIAALRDRIRRLEQPSALRHGVLPFGIAEIDGALPGGGLALGALHDIVGQGGDEEDGAAAVGFAAGIAARLGLGLEKGGPVLWCLKRPDLYGPGLAAFGLDPSRLVLLRAPRDEDILWAVEEGLRCPGLAAVIGEIGRLSMVASRRLQLAAERSGVTALLLRRWRNAGEAASERGRPNAALTRWRVGALPSFSASANSFALKASNQRSFRGPTPDLIRGRQPGTHEHGMGQVGADGDATSANGGVLGFRARGFAAPRNDRVGFGSLDKAPTGGGIKVRGALQVGVGRRRWRIELLRCRGGEAVGWDVEFDDATGALSLPAGLADRPAAPGRRPSWPVPERLSG